MISIWRFSVPKNNNEISTDGLTFLDDGEVLYNDLYLLSETDEKGIVLYASDSFLKIANMTNDEIIGQPHNIVRHPEMPRVAFKSLWDDVVAKGFWTGLVKNIRKDRSFYWVHATALRQVKSDGTVTYLSVRVVPNRQEIEPIIPVYAELKAQE